jgi:hypothetical protein
MRTRSPGGNDKEVGDNKKIADFEENDLGSLFVGDGVGSEPGCAGCVYGRNLLDPTRINPLRHNIPGI